METWFLAALAGAVLAGFANFYFKMAASRGYNPELFSLYGGVLSIFIVSAWALVAAIPITQTSLLYVGLSFCGGILIASNNIIKVYALRYIDATIYFPLYKLLAPAVAIVLGVLFFAETFSKAEWIGMIAGLFVPLLLITKAENGRQNNLLAGLIFVLLTGVFSAGGAALYKFSIDAGVTAVMVLFHASFGLFFGSLGVTLYKLHWRKFIKQAKEQTSTGLLYGAGLRCILITASFACTLYAFQAGGTLAVVQTIQSFYILIPIVLAIIFYNEHWNLQKVVAIVLSVAALALLG